MIISVLLTACCLAGSAAAGVAGNAQRPLLGHTPAPAIGSSELLELHKSLVEMSSITGAERGVSDFLADYLRGHGFTVETQDVVDDRQNVLAYVGSARSTRVLLTSHIDTVPPYWPYERRGGEIWGRGTVDAKGSVATQVMAVRELLEQGAIGEGDAALLFVVGEERDGLGMKAANDLGLTWEAVIFGEPTELKLASGHKGGMGLTIRAKGKAGHSGYPELGKNAIDLLVHGLAVLQNLELPASDHFGNSTLNIGLIDGGVARNVIPEEAAASGLVRIAAGGPEDIKELIENALREAAPELKTEFSFGLGPVPIDHDIEGFDTIVVNYGTDIPNLKGAHKRYLYGPGTILLAHSDHEHLSIEDLESAVNGYKVLLTKNLRLRLKVNMSKAGVSG